MRPLVACVVAALALAAAASAAEPGVTAGEVALGGTVPLSGEAAAFGSVGPGAKAYFDYVNARGGVHGRKIRYLFRDDGYDPSRTVVLTRQLVEQDKVFAIFNSVGTESNKAIQPYLNQAKVPQLYVGDGSDSVIRPRLYPWTMGFLQSYRGEGAVYGRNIVRTKRQARIAVLLQNDDLGKDMTRGLSRAIAGKGPKVVASESYEFTASDVSSQIAKLKATGADTLLLFATPKFVIQAVVAAHRLAWRPQLYIASVSIEPGIMAIARANAPELTKGALSIAFVKNPNDPIWDRDPVMALYRKVMKAHLPSGKVSDVYNFYGMTVAWTMVETLQRAGKNLTRAGLLKAAQSLDTSKNPFLLPGIRLGTSATDYFPLDTIYLGNRLQEDIQMKMSIRVAVLAAVAALGALALAAPATAAYTKPTLEVTYTGTTTNIVASAVDVGTTTNDEDATYRATIYAPLGTTLTTNQAAGTVIGTVSAQVNALGLGGALLPLAGNIVVAAPGQVTPTQQAQCIQTQTPTVTWALVLQAAGQTLTVPAYVVATAGTETQLGPAKVVFCLTPPDVPTAQGGATFGAKFRQADLKVNGVFGTVNEGAWIAIWTPYFPLNGQPNAPATVASPAAIAPGQVTLAVAKSGRTRVRLTATLTQGGQPTAGAVQIFAGARRTALKRVKILKAGANGKATFTYAGKGIFFRLRGSAAARSAPPLCAALGALPAPCVNPTVTGFSELSAIVRRPA